jgi:hypothetical protein
VALGRYYKVGVYDTATPLGTGATVATTTVTPILYGVTTAANDCNITAIRMSVMGAAAFPSNASNIISINIVTGTVGGGNTATAIQLSGVTKAATTTFLTAGGTSAAAITSLTQTTYMWSQNLPFTAGANWGEWYTPGFEINIPVSTKFALYIQSSSAGTATTFAGEIEFSE